MAKKETDNKKIVNKKIKTTSREKVEPIIEEKAEVVESKEIPTVDVVVEDAIANTIEEIIEAPVNVVEEAVEEVKKITKKVDRTFGYLWNGQAIDF